MINGMSSSIGSNIKSRSNETWTSCRQRGRHNVPSSKDTKYLADGNAVARGDRDWIVSTLLRGILIQGMRFKHRQVRVW